jgi:uncharacterized repeat protein (TIGR03803 family)
MRLVIMTAQTALATVLSVALAATGQAQTFKVLHAFAEGTDGSEPHGTPLVSGGMLYGTTYIGGSATDVGTVFKLDLTTGTETILHVFGSISPTDGIRPQA